MAYVDFDISDKFRPKSEGGWAVRNRMYSETGVEKGKRQSNRQERLPPIKVEVIKSVPADPDDLD